MLQFFSNSLAVMIIVWTLLYRRSLLNNSQLKLQIWRDLSHFCKVCLKCYRPEIVSCFWILYLVCARKAETLHMYMGLYGLSINSTVFFYSVIIICIIIAFTCTVYCIHHTWNKYLKVIVLCLKTIELHALFFLRCFEPLKVLLSALTMFSLKLRVFHM